MSFTFKPLSIPDIILVESTVFTDLRGGFLETFKSSEFRKAGQPDTFLQDNLSWSKKDVIRGLHYQKTPKAQGKLVSVLKGRAWDVAVDIRRGSPTFGKWVGDELTDENHAQLFIPRGFAHGFCVLSETADVLYKCTDYYDPTDDHGLLWSDPELAIAWPVSNPLVSGKDIRQPRLCDVAADQLPAYGDR